MLFTVKLLIRQGRPLFFVHDSNHARDQADDETNYGHWNESAMPYPKAALIFEWHELSEWVDGF